MCEEAKSDLDRRVEEEVCVDLTLCDGTRLLLHSKKGVLEVLCTVREQQDWGIELDASLHARHCDVAPKLVEKLKSNDLTWFYEAQSDRHGSIGLPNLLAF